jgi:DNA-binding PadR family transcriptional regulator
MDGWIPYPSTCIAGTTGWRLYYVRKLLKELKQEGLITSDLWVEQGDERPILVRGYVLTEKGKDTDEYRQAWERERQICKECFDFDIGDVDRYNEALKLDEKTVETTGIYNFDTDE